MKKRWLILGTVCAGVLFFLFTSRPLLFFDAEFAKESPVQGNLQHKIIDIPDSEKDAVIDAFTKVKIPCQVQYI